MDGDSRTRVFVHSRDVVARKQLPRGGRVDLRLKASEKGWCGEGVRLLEATDAEVDALLGSSAMALSETLFLPVAPDPVPPPPLANSPEPPRPVTP